MQKMRLFQEMFQECKAYWHYLQPATGSQHGIVVCDYVAGWLGQ